MAMQVYGDSTSGNCLKVKWVLDHLKSSYEWFEVDVLSGRTRSAEFLALNPAGQVPAARLDDGRPLSQSGAIMLYAAEGSDLIPTDPYDRAVMFEWMFWEQYSHEPYVAVRRFLMAHKAMAEAELDPKLWERGSGALQRMEKGLEGRDWFAGPRLSLADIALVAYTRMAGDGGFDLSGYPRITAWIARVEDALSLGRYAGYRAARAAG